MHPNRCGLVLGGYSDSHREPGCRKSRDVLGILESLSYTEGPILTYIDYGLIIADGAEHFETRELPLAAFRGIYRTNLDVSMNGRGVLVDEFESILGIVFVGSLVRHKQGKQQTRDKEGSIQQRYGAPTLWLQAKELSASHAIVTARAFPSLCICRYLSVKHGQT